MQFASEKATEDPKSLRKVFRFLDLFPTSLRNISDLWNLYKKFLEFRASLKSIRKVAGYPKNAYKYFNKCVVNASL